MKHSIDCLPCLLRQAVRTAKTHIPDEETQLALLKEIMKEMLVSDNDASAPFIAHRIQEIMVNTLDNPDPYQEDKEYYNREMLNIESELIKLRDSCENPFAAALKMAGAGNIIDFGPGYDLSREKVLEIVETTMKIDLPGEVLLALRNDLRNAATLLYLGDNAGEIVFDKIFIDVIKNSFPELKIYFAARGKPVLNDITEADAYRVEMDKLAEIINNGTSIPGTDLEHCSAVFSNIYNKADVVISKGQGNFETLYGSGRQSLYYLFLCKCNLFMERLGAQQNDLIFLKE
jgi:uncharacterized protein with ATP-grasp and redox domains